jgi:hypothetical protein
MARTVMAANLPHFSKKKVRRASELFGSINVKGFSLILHFLPERRQRGIFTPWGGERYSAEGGTSFGYLEELRGVY